jgi:hypothetical protein
VRRLTTFGGMALRLAARDSRLRLRLECVWLVAIGSHQMVECRTPVCIEARRGFVHFLIPENGMCIEKVLTLYVGFLGDRGAKMYFDAYRVCSQAITSAWTKKKNTHCWSVTKVGV